MALSKEREVIMNWKPNEDKVLKTHFLSSPKDTILKLLPNRTWNSIQKRARDALGLHRNPEKKIIKRETVDTKIKEITIKDITKQFMSKEKLLLKRIQGLELLLNKTKEFSDVDTYSIKYKEATTISRSTAFTIWGDWHSEEEVKGEAINNLNRFNLDICQRRVEYLSNRVVRFVRMYRKDTEIDKLVIVLGGDFITGNIHMENLESSLLRPIDAIIFAEKLIASAIEFVDLHLQIDITVVCVVGNHPRITKKVRHSTEMGNSLEYYMYHQLAKYFSGASNSGTGNDGGRVSLIAFNIINYKV